MKEIICPVVDRRGDRFKASVKLFKLEQNCKTKIVKYLNVSTIHIIFSYLSNIFTE